jgi:peptide deformylase
MDDDALAGLLQLGDARLRRRARSAAEASAAELADARTRTRATLAAFRRRMGFGRALAAPQLGLDLRVIALDLGQGPFTIVDPEILARSDATMSLWDDCMCFPELLVRVRRHVTITLRFVDEQGREQIWHDLDPARAELLQHEIDHLDGILALDRAEPPPGAALGEAIVLRRVYDTQRDAFESRVDFAIVPTISRTSEQG